MEKIVQAIDNHIVAAALFAMLTMPLSARLAAQSDMQQTVTGAQGATLSRRDIRDAADRAHQDLGVVPPHFAELKLAQGFLLNLNVLDDPDFTGAFRVDGAGNIGLPVLGSMHVAGKTVPQLREEIARSLLERGILKDPQVELDVVEYTAPEVTILGAVSTPGVFPLLSPEGLGEVLALAGDTTILAGNKIQITDPNGGSEPKTVHYSRGMDTSLLNSIIVRPGDTVQVTQAGCVYVLGGVNRPGGYVMQENGSLSVLQAVSIAGGTSITASIKFIYVMRKSSDNATVWLQFPYKKMTQGKVADVRLERDDVIYVPISGVKSAFISSEGVLAAVSSASIYSGVIH
jgi:polysaccharide export outer membrane protein